jgi:hypothetical protein
MLEWMHDHRILLYSSAGVSVALFVVGWVVIPAMLARIPADYFDHPHRPARGWAHRRRSHRVTIQVSRNMLGYVCLVAGLIMMFTPGPAMPTLLIGFMLVDFPGKYRAEQWLISRPRVLKAINWLRRRRGRAPLRVAAR